MCFMIDCALPVSGLNQEMVQTWSSLEVNSSELAASVEEGPLCACGLQKVPDDKKRYIK